MSIFQCQLTVLSCNIFSLKCAKGDELPVVSAHLKEICDINIFI